MALMRQVEIVDIAEGDDMVAPLPAVMLMTSTLIQISGALTLNVKIGCGNADRKPHSGCVAN